jgi:hypothetical protein
MKHNYCNWELTQLLPETPPILNKDNNSTIWIVKASSTLREFITITDGRNDTLDSIADDEDSNTRQAWSWEDIRLYLEEQGFRVSIYLGVIDDSETSWVFDVKTEVDIEKDSSKGIYNYIKTYHSFQYNTGWWKNYEECRIESIKYCLNVIKQNK